MAVVEEQRPGVEEAAPRHLNELIEVRISRRTVIAGGMAAVATFMVGGTAADAAVQGRRGGGASLLGFDAVPLSFDDDVAVPPGYTAQVLIPWGTAIVGSYPAFRPGQNTADQQAEQIGMGHDGMHYFPLGGGRSGNRRGLLVLNHEFTNENYLQTGTEEAPPPEAYTPEMVLKSQNAHGVAIVEIARAPNGTWRVVRSRYNRRITANTPMAISGPAAGHRLLRTAADPRGRRPLGTVNNCAHGYTPWSTYLTCEENFQGYFRLDPGAYSAEQTELQEAYGIGGDEYNWATEDPRFALTPGGANEPNRFGWVVEIDPFEPNSRPIKRTALGRCRHEGAFVHEARGKRIVVYMGDDEVNQFVYKFVSARNWRALRAQGKSPFDEGTLYVARFDDDGRGEWLPLVHDNGPLTRANGFANQGDVLVKTRLAAQALGATPMDRPEWTSVDPTTGLVYVTLTNNTSEEKQESAANPRLPNPWGHILRWEEAGGDHTATRFEWDIFLLAGQGRSSGDGSTIDDDDAFGSPDGLWVDPDGRVWIQTDGSQPTDANDQMLAADPYQVDREGRPELRRFLTGVPACEVTGVITTPDQRTMFVNIQHPGDGEPSRWPQDDTIATPRPATVVITKDDGGVIGS